MISYTISRRRRASQDPTHEYGLTFSSSSHPPDYVVQAAIQFFPPPPSSSAESASIVTPATETPAPSSPQSSNTSVSANVVVSKQPSHVVDPPPTAEPSSANSPLPLPPTTPPVAAETSVPKTAPVAPIPVKAAPKTWSALFVKPKSSTPTPIASQTPNGSQPSTAPPTAAPSPRPTAAANRPPPTSLPKLDPTTLLTNPSLPILVHPTPLLHPRGLVNIGNMCFANSILQVLTYCPPFWRIFVQGLGPIFDEVGQMGSGRSQCALLEATLSFVRDFKLASEVELPKDPLPGEAGFNTKRTVQGKPLTVEQRRKESFNQDAFIPEFLYEAMKANKRFDSMQKGHQEDAEEFLGFFLDTLHEELIFVTERLEANPSPAESSPKVHRKGRSSTGTVVAADEDAREVHRPLSPMGGMGAINGTAEGDDGWMEVGKKNKVVATRTTKSRESVITKIFGGKLRSVLKMPGPGDTSATLEPYQPLQLDIQSDSIQSIDDALRHITLPETLSMRSSKGLEVSATKQVFIETVPPILVLHIKRFIYDASVGGMGVIKSQKVIGYGPTLSIPHDVMSPLKRNGPLIRYQLFGVVYHHGKHATGGHYTVDVLRQDYSEWIRIDDTNIEPVREDEVVTINAEGLRNPKADAGKINPTTGVPDKVAYLLFYKRIF